MGEFNKLEVEKFRIWLDQFSLRRSSQKKYCYAVYTMLEKTKSLDEESLNKFLKKHPRDFYRVGVKKYLKFKEIRNIDLAKVKLPPRKPLNVPPFEQLQGILKKIKAFPSLLMDIYWMVALLLQTGPRIIEVLILKLEDIEPSKCLIKYRVTKTDDNRPIKVSREFMDKLYHYLSVEKGILGGQRCFLTHLKDPEISASAYQTFRNYMDKLVKAKILTPDEIKIIKKSHNFRRSVINHLLDLTNYNILSVGQYVGHKKAETTMRYADDLTKQRAKQKSEDIMVKEKIL